MEVDKRQARVGSPIESAIPAFSTTLYRQAVRQSDGEYSGRSSRCHENSHIAPLYTSKPAESPFDNQFPAIALQVELADVPPTAIDVCEVHLRMRVQPQALRMAHFELSRVETLF